MGKMIRLSRVVAVTFFSLTLPLLISAAEVQEVTIYCDNNYPPYSYVENGTPTGIYADIFKTAFSRMKGYRITIIAVPYKRGLKMMEEGEGFALYPPYYRPKIRPYMDYPIPVLDEVYSILAPKSEGGDKAWPEAYVGKTIGTNLGFSLPDAEKARKLGVIIEEAVTGRANILKLIMGRLDAYINDKNSILWELKQLENSGEYDPTKGPELIIVSDISKEQGFLGVTNKDNGAFKFKADFVAEFVEIIKDMKANGEIQMILESYIK